MTDIVLRVENLSKSYRLGRARARHDTLRDALVGIWPRLVRKGNSCNSCNSWPSDLIWALEVGAGVHPGATFFGMAIAMGYNDHMFDSSSWRR